MAANLQSRGVASFGKLFVSKISSNTRNSASLSREPQQRPETETERPEGKAASRTCERRRLAAARRRLEEVRRRLAELRRSAGWRRRGGGTELKREEDESETGGRRRTQGRGVHVSVYDKNPEEHAQPSVVPDEVIQPQSDKYWAPHPQTGVFGPDTDNNPATASGERGFHFASPGTVDSVLEEKAFFRPLEDLEKPQVHP